MSTPMKPGQRYRGYWITQRYFDGVLWRVGINWTYQHVGKKIFDEKEELVTRLSRVPIDPITNTGIIHPYTGL